MFLTTNRLWTRWHVSSCRKIRQTFQQDWRMQAFSNSDAAEHVFDVENGKVLVLVEEGEGHLGTAER
ncbi:hypothetical protein RCO48_38935 [Peribacillus frigoritolerans]|nr:hypothetical protein [Peribacillus frigoritolerans]